jgi:hypothetical protein
MKGSFKGPGFLDAGDVQGGHNVASISNNHGPGMRAALTTGN